MSINRYMDEDVVYISTWNTAQYWNGMEYYGILLQWNTTQP